MEQGRRLVSVRGLERGSGRRRRAAVRAGQSPLLLRPPESSSHLDLATFVCFGGCEHQARREFSRLPASSRGRRHTTTVAPTLIILFFDNSILLVTRRKRFGPLTLLAAWHSIRDPAAIFTCGRKEGMHTGTHQNSGAVAQPRQRVYPQNESYVGTSLAACGVCARARAVAYAQTVLPRNS